MIRERHPETGKMRFTNLAKGIAGGIVFLITVAGAIIAIDDRYISEAEATSRFQAIETQNVSTFEQYQKGLRLEQQVIQKSREMQLLEDY